MCGRRQYIALSPAARFVMTEHDGMYRMLVAELKKYFQLHVDYYKLTMVEKLSLLLSAVAVAGIVAVLLFIALFYLASALQVCLSQYVGDAWSYVVVAVIFAVFGVLVIIFKKSMIVDPICRLVSKIFIEPK